MTELELALQKLGELEARFKNMADHSPVLLWMSGTDGLCNFFNQTWLDFTGRTLEDEWGVGWSEAIHHEDFQRCMDTYVEHFNARTPFEMEYRLLRHDGEYRWILDRGAPRYLPDGTFSGFIGSCIDITDRKHAEEQLVRAKQEAEAANAAKSNFLAIVSHEIRTPLGAVIGFSDLLATEDRSASEKINWSNSVKRNGALLLNIINSILDLSKIEAGHFALDLKPISLSELIDEVVVLLGFQASEKGILFEVKELSSIPGLIMMDATRLKQILVNVAGNAIKFTSKGSVQIEVSSSLERESQHRIRFDIVDTGDGFDGEKAQLIFEPFRQADDSLRRKHGGTGLGLTLSRELARAFGGDVTLLRTEPGKGSAFRVEIIAEETLESPTHAPHSLTIDTNGIKPLEGMNVLVVDDSKDNQILASRYLKSAGAQVKTADNGEDGVKRAMEGDYSVVLMDIQMPGKDGFEALQELRQQGYTKPIVALTAYALEHDRQRVFEHGFDGHLSKPIDKERLVAAVRSLSLH